MAFVDTSLFDKTPEQLNMIEQKQRIEQQMQAQAKEQYIQQTAGRLFANAQQEDKEPEYRMVSKTPTGADKPSYFKDNMDEINAWRKAHAEKQSGSALDSADATLLKNMRNFAADVMTKYPDKGITLLKEADLMADKISQRQKEKLTTERDKIDLAGEYYAMAKDPESWERSKELIRNLGISIPKRFNDWSPETSKFAETQVGLSQRGREMQQLELNRHKSERDDLKFEEDKRKTKVKEANEAAKLEQAKAGFLLKKGDKWREPKAEELSIEGKTLAAQDERFKDLSSEEQTRAERDVRLAANHYLNSGLAPDAMTADSMARESVLSSIKDGKYTGIGHLADQALTEKAAKESGGFKTTAPTGSSAEQLSPDEIIQIYLDTNPNLSREDAIKHAIDKGYISRTEDQTTEPNKTPAKTSTKESTGAFTQNLLDRIKTTSPKYVSKDEIKKLSPAAARQVFEAAKKRDPSILEKWKLWSDDMYDLWAEDR